MMWERRYFKGARRFRLSFQTARLQDFTKHRPVASETNRVLKSRLAASKPKGALNAPAMKSQLSLFEPPIFQYGPPLSLQQAKVRDHGAGNQVVVAGAGTGKTETLIQRILKLLVEGDGASGPVELEQILALTFTDKGAAEMRGRVYARLVEILRALPRGEARSRLENVRAGFGENNRILTFDAFSFRLLSQFPEHSSLVGELEILDSAARRRGRREVARQFWNRVESSFAPEQKRELWELLELFSSRRAALETMGKLAETENEDDLRQLSRLPDEREWKREWELLVARDGQRLWRAVEDEIEKVERNAPLPPEMRRELLNPERVLAPARSGIVGKDDWSAAFKKRWSPELIFGLDRVGRRLREWKIEASTERDAALDWQSRRAVAHLCAHAGWWQNAQREWCAQNGVASFSDIAAAALEMASQREVAAQLRASFSHILIDEFQDTNWRQWALIEELRDAMRGNVLIVGDEKQAIFRFRGGDITVFDGVRKMLLGREHFADELTVSRRSTRQLVNWTNAVFQDVLPSVEARQAFEAPFQALQSESEASENGLWKLSPQSWHLAAENALWGDKLPPLAMQRERAGRALARFVRQLCDDAQLWRENESPALRFPDLAPISRKIARGQSAIGVVFTSHAVKSIFETQLRAFDVPFVAVKGTGFWNSEPVTWTLHLLQILLDGSDKTAFVGLARSPFGGLSDVALLEWHLALEADAERVEGAFCGAVEGFRPSRPDDARAWEIFVARLENWRDLARVEATSEVLERVLERSEVAFYEAGLPDAAQREQNWRKILDIVREREDAGEGGLRALIDHLSALVREAEGGEKEADAPLPSQGSIVLMTVWAAKGLGFPMTILAQLDDAPRVEGAHLLRGNLHGERQMAFRLGEDDEDESGASPWLWEKLRAGDFAEEEAQWRRLFYVACTRAASHLVLLCPEREVKNAAAWTNLSDAHRDQMTDLRPVGELPREGKGAESAAPFPLPSAPPLPRAMPQEVALVEVCGARAEKFAARARDWMETRVAVLGGEAEQIREEVPFSAPARELGVAGEWVVGAWEWLAPLLDESLVLAASGENGKIAARRAHLMALAARNSGFEVRETWALSPLGDGMEGALVEI